MKDNKNKGICIRNAHLHPNLSTSISDCEQYIYIVRTNRSSNRQKAHRAPGRAKSVNWSSHYGYNIYLYTHTIEYTRDSLR